MIRPDPVRRVLVGVTCLAWLVGAEPAAAQKPKSEEETTREFRALAWQRGPTDGHMGGTATIKVGDGQAFLDGQNTRRFLELNGNPPRDNHYTLVSQDPNWFAVFHFEDRGYVKDDEKLDPGAILKALKDSDEPGNAERKRLGMAPLYTDGWHVPPHYDAATRRLEWGVRLRGDTGPPVVNYTVRILGRRGVMSATLVSDPQRLDTDIVAFKAALGNFGFVPGERYAEFRAGDRVAEYGLAALVLGGAAVVATKTGFLKAFGKLILVGVVAFGGAAAAFFRKFFRRS